MQSEQDFKYLKDAMEEAGWNLYEKEGEKTVWCFKPKGEDLDLPFKTNDNRTEEDVFKKSFSISFFDYREMYDYLENIKLVNQNMDSTPEYQHSGPTKRRGR